MNTRLDARCGGSLHRSEAAQLARSFGLWELSDAASASNPIDMGENRAEDQLHQRCGLVIDAAVVRAIAGELSLAVAHRAHQTTVLSVEVRASLALSAIRTANAPGHANSCGEAGEILVVSWSGTRG